MTYLDWISGNSKVSVILSSWAFQISVMLLFIFLIWKQSKNSCSDSCPIFRFLMKISLLSGLLFLVSKLFVTWFLATIVVSYPLWSMQQKKLRISEFDRWLSWLFLWSIILLPTAIAMLLYEVTVSSLSQNQVFTDFRPFKGFLKELISLPIYFWLPYLATLIGLTFWTEKKEKSNLTRVFPIILKTFSILVLSGMIIWLYPKIP